MLCFFCEYAVILLAVGDRLLACRVVGDSGYVALCGEVNVAGRICIIKAIYTASVVFEEVADSVVGVIGGFVDRNGTLYETGGKTNAGQSQQKERTEIFFHGGWNIYEVSMNPKIVTFVFL